MSRWHGNNDTTQKNDRARAARMLPCPCYRCGALVTADMPWDADHDPPRSQPGSRLVGPSHRSCNRRAGAGRRPHGRPAGQAAAGFLGGPPPLPPPSGLAHTRRESAGHSLAEAYVPPVMHEDGWVFPRIASEPRPGTSYDLADELLGWVDAHAPGEPLAGWQRWAWRRMWETADGRLWPVVLLLISRQQGKTYLVRRALLARAMRGQELFGQRQTVLNVAPSYSLAEDLMEPWAREMVDRGHGRFLSRHSNYADWRVDGRESGSQWLVRAMREGALRGVAGVTCAFIDEVQSTPYRMRRSLRPTMSGSRLRNTQMILAGTGALAGAEHLVTHEQSRLLRELRQQAMSGGNVLLLEWSAPEDADPADERNWMWASPDWSQERLDFLRSEADSSAFASEYLVEHQPLDGDDDLPGEALADAQVWADRRADLRVPASAATASMVAAVEERHGRGGAVALAWWDDSGRLSVWATRLPLPECWDFAGRAGRVVCGMTLRLTPEAVTVGAVGVGSAETSAALPTLRERLESAGLSWSGDGLADQVGVRVRPAAGRGGLSPVAGQESDCVRVAAWAVRELLNAPVESPAVF